MEDGDGCPTSAEGSGEVHENTPEKVMKGDQRPQSPADTTQGETNCKLSIGFKGFDASLDACSQESNCSEPRLNGEVESDSSNVTNCDSLVASDNSSPLKPNGDRTSSDGNDVDVDTCGSRESLETTLRKRKICGSPDSVQQSDSTQVTGNVQNSGFKKRILSCNSKFSKYLLRQKHSLPNVEEPIRNRKVPPTSAASRSLSAVKQPLAKSVDKKSDTPLTEYAQYLGLQPTLKFKCVKCEETGFPTFSKLQEHQSLCLSNMIVPICRRPTKPHVPGDNSVSSTNFRISRKVFLCSSCGTYYENWNLFLHMREVHKKFICLYCLSMFAQSDSLATHLTTKHGIVETHYSSPERLFVEGKGSYFMMCCTCDAIFTERDDFTDHICLVKQSTCMPGRFCSVRGKHLPSCSKYSGGIDVSKSAAGSLSSTDGDDSKSPPNRTPNILSCDRSGTLLTTQYLIPMSSVQVPFKRTAKKLRKLESDDSDLSDGDDDYDISNAASFCHVNIHEPIEKSTRASTSLATTSKKDPSLDLVSSDNALPLETTMLTETTTTATSLETSITTDKSVGESITNPTKSLASNSLLPSSSAVNVSPEDDCSQLSKDGVKEDVVNVSLANSEKLHNDDSVSSKKLFEAIDDHPLQSNGSTVNLPVDDTAGCSKRLESTDTIVIPPNPLNSEDTNENESPKKEVLQDPVMPTLHSEIEFDTTCLSTSPPKLGLGDTLSPTSSVKTLDGTLKLCELEPKVSGESITDKTDVLECGSSDSGASSRNRPVPCSPQKINDDVLSPTQADQVEHESPLTIVKAPSPPLTRSDSINTKSPKIADLTDPKSPLKIDLDSLTKSNIIQPEITLTPDSKYCKSPENNSTYDIDSSILAAAEDWNDVPKSPLMVVKTDTSDIHKPTAFDVLGLSKSMELNDSSKSVSSRESNRSPQMEDWCDSSSSPITTVLMNETARSLLNATPPSESRQSASSNSLENVTLQPISVSELHDSISKSPLSKNLNDYGESLQQEDSCCESSVSPPLSDDDECNSNSLSTKILPGNDLIPADGTYDTNLNSSDDTCLTNFNPSSELRSDNPFDSTGIKLSKTKRSERSRKKVKESVISSRKKLKITFSNKLTEAQYESNIPELEKSEDNEDRPCPTNGKVKRKKRAKGGKRIRSTKKSSISKMENIENKDSPEKLLDKVPWKSEDISDNIQCAGDDVPVMDLILEDELEVLTIQIVLQESVKSACTTCVYCNHAKKIAVNGKQLALHLLAEHKFLPVYTKSENSLTMLSDELFSKNMHPDREHSSTQMSAIDETEQSAQNKILMEKYVHKLKDSLTNLQDLFLNTDTYDSSDRTFSQPYDRTYECFHCHFLTMLHKELYVHNRKMHQKTILLCIMCKSNFYSYSELLCHLCPGIYVPESNINFRCHICLVDSLPSTFRLMVHLRKRHFVCDVCLEITDDQQKLSTHVWKHKLHHLCYRCGIAYRNKPDITKHLFWKHGTESVLCKKCLQKKWPHVYHFCIPPNAFICEECNASFSRAVALKVHKRLHSGDLLHKCSECSECFISKKLQLKHEDKHREIPEPKMDELDSTPPIKALDFLEELPELKEDVAISEVEPKILTESHERSIKENLSCAETGIPSEASIVCDLTKQEEKSEKKSEVVDVYDLPPLNLSSDSDDSDGEQEVKNTALTSVQETVDGTLPASPKSDEMAQEEDNQQPVPVVDGIWDNFQNYKASLERRESQSSDNAVVTNPASVFTRQEIIFIMLDHDYCLVEEDKDKMETDIADQVLPSVDSPFASDLKVPSSMEEAKVDDKKNSFDHDYCFNKDETGESKEDTSTKKEITTNYVDACSTNPTTSRDTSSKKQKSPKKKKRSTSSSSSDSSSSSGSSSCSCGENCSCSSSSSSSDSSSDSSDSEKSTSEGRRRQIARKERRDRAKKKKAIEAPAFVTTATPEPEEQNQVCPPLEPEEKEIPIRESDLDTDETETDEDFYDEHPQLLANKLMAEKRNQLLLLAAVAPINNVPQPEPAPPSTSEISPQRKKVKSKKRKKRQHDTEKNTDNKLKLNISAKYFNFQGIAPDAQPSYVDSHAFSSVHHAGQSMLSRLPPAPSLLTSSVDPACVSSAPDSGSETDSKRLSKRRRVPKKFYGDSSGDDSSSHTKWSRKPQPAVISSPLPCSPSPVPTYKTIAPIPEPSRVPPIVLTIPEPERSEEEDGVESESEQGDVKKSSCESSSESDGEKDLEIHTDSDAEPPLVVETPPVQQPAAKKNVSLYCYCQCPYDEVSEMIACDGKDCIIEWFHFECVGIMVPPKGKWYCPDCRKNSTKTPFLS